MTSLQKSTKHFNSQAIVEIRMESKAHSGLSCCGDLEWGSHFCHLYETREDLIDTLVPFFSTGLEENDKCLWVTSEPLKAVDAIAALKEKMPDLARYMKSGQIQIIDHDDWYVHSGKMDVDAVLQSWIDTEQQALAEGYSGLRITGNISFIQSREDWCAFEQYESRVTEFFAGHRIIALCSYHLEKTTGQDILDVVQNHNFSVARRRGTWEMIENAATKIAKQDLYKANLGLEKLVSERTSELHNVLAILKEQKRELESVLQMRDASQEQLKAELADAELLHSISAALINEGVVGDFYQKLVDAAGLVMRSDYASMQRFEPESNSLQLLAHRGFNDEALAFWEWVTPKQPTSCGWALHLNKRVVVTNFEEWEHSAGEDLVAFRAAGVLSAQSTPLLSRTGTLVGMITTHWKRTHNPSERDLRLIDIIARQAADLIERNTAAEALRLQANRLEEADRRKDEFLAMLAHELRNPLSPISAAADILSFNKLSEEKIHQCSDIISRQVKHMTSLIDDLLDVSRVTGGLITLKPEKINLIEMINHSSEQVKPLVENYNHQLFLKTPAQPIFVMGDRHRLIQIFTNILNNAAKYTPKGGSLNLTLEAEGEFAKIVVSDNGIGMDEELVKHAFELFTQASRTSDRSQGGLGIGLALVKSLVELHQGSVSISSQGIGKGCEVEVLLPLLTADKESEPIAFIDDHLTQTPTIEAIKIMVVDDNAANAEMVASLLEMTGYEVVVEYDSLKALERSIIELPSIYILDVGLPIMDGKELARRLKKQPETKNATLIALSGYSKDQEIVNAKEAGFDHYVVKPFEFKKFLALLSSLEID
ncbi:MAG: MEDS domain-containing protein [Bacteroidia bacterium]|nr:MEDS domain-containing protein [Methylotenera sp.]